MPHIIPRPLRTSRRALSRAAVVLTLLATTTGGGAVAADNDEAVYLRRFQESGGAARDSYDTLETVAGAKRPKPLPVAAKTSISSEALAQAQAYAAANRSTALLIWRDGALEGAGYFGATTDQTLLISRSMAKPLSAIAVGRAIALGKIRSLDQPVSDFIPEWRGTPKAAILVRHLLDMRAGFLAQGASPDPANIWSRAYLHPRHGPIIINEYPLTAKPGERYAYANATADLVAVLIERATGRRYGDFLSAEVLQPLGAQGGKIWVDHPGGLAHSGCCILLPAETWLRLGVLLLDDGVWGGKRLLPPGYVAAMRTPTAANPYYGLGVWVQGPYTQRRGFASPEPSPTGVLHGEPYLANDLFLFDGNADQVLYMAPHQRLAILRMGDAPPKSPEWDNSVLPNLILRDLATAAR
jgi:CubicO group peptidase (beta-lactamase class C family)